LVVERDRELAGTLRRWLERDGHQVSVAGDAAAGLAALGGFNPDAVVIDAATADCGGGPGLLGRFRAADANAPVIALAAGAIDARTVESLAAAGAFVLARPSAPGALTALLDQAFGARRLAGALDYYRERDARHAGLAHLIGESVPMLRLKTAIRLLLDAEADAAAPAPVLVVGEPGSGKERAARALHLDGVRRDGTFVRLEWAAAGASPEVRLFGCEPGARPGVHERRLGLIEAADGGTLYVDEIAHTSAALQARLLALVEQGTLRRVGGTRDIRVDLRLVVATRHSLPSLQREGRLSAALGARLEACAALEMAPLRKRGDDVFLLAERFLKRHAERRDKPVPRLADTARSALARHDWPDNVRELHHALERAVWLESRGVVEARHLMLDPAAWGALPEPAAPAETSLPQLERAALVRALDRSLGNVSKAARLLGVTRDTVRYRVAKHGLADRRQRWAGGSVQDPR
jgi:DNA-binding NtrC family response regulator